MRVDTGALYTLINRVVEIGIEIQSLDDLALVSFGGDPARMLAGWRAQIARVSSELSTLKDDAVSLVNVPLSEAIETFPQFVRFLGRRLGKNVRLDIIGADIQIDRQIVDLLREPLRHLIVNAVDHGLEPPAERAAAGKAATGVVRLSAEIEDDRLILSVGDDGRGVDWGASDVGPRKTDSLPPRASCAVTCCGPVSQRSTVSPTSPGPGKAWHCSPMPSTRCPEAS
jgi:two-component system, chemotaxis family, sensor kinase CheA